MSRRLHSVNLEEIIEAMASRHGAKASQYAKFRESRNRRIEEQADRLYQLSEHDVELGGDAE